MLTLRKAGLTLALTFVVLPAGLGGANAQSLSDAGRSGGGPIPEQTAQCISPAEYAQVEKNIARFYATHGAPFVNPNTASVPYVFYPQAGTLWDDLFLNNFVDLDPTSGIKDFDCTNWTYDGHTGHDSGIHTFDEQAIGVPIFAALDGVVVDAHDGEYDMNTTWNNQPANYVVLDHGNNHRTYYWHMKKGSVAVSIGQYVTAGQQIGLTGSSGISTGPHLHFETHLSGKVYEPFAGPCRPGASAWLHQPPVRRDMYLEEFNVSNAYLENYPGLPYDLPRAGTFVQGNGVNVAFWMILHNLPANSSWEIRYLRPDGSVAFDSGVGYFNNNVDYRWSWWWWRYYVNLDTLGTWYVDFQVNGSSLIQAPFDVVASANQIVNRAPDPVSAAFDPPSPGPGDVIFCRVAPSLLRDPDYDLVRFHYQWSINGNIVRDVVNAADSDAIPYGLGKAGDTVMCVVTPNDGTVDGPSTGAQAILNGATLKTLTLTPATVAGSLSAKGTVTLSAAAPNDTVVTLTSNNAVATVPLDITIPAGATSQSFAIKTKAVTSPVNATIQAKIGAGTISSTLTVRPIGVKSVTLTPNPVVGGSSVTGKVTLEAKIPAGFSGITVTLSSSNPSVANPTVTSITIPAGASTGAFTINTSHVAANTAVTISAAANSISKTAKLTVTP